MEDCLAGNTCISLGGDEASAVGNNCWVGCGGLYILGEAPFGPRAESAVPRRGGGFIEERFDRVTVDCALRSTGWRSVEGSAGLAGGFRGGMKSLSLGRRGGDAGGLMVRDFACAGKLSRDVDTGIEGRIGGIKSGSFLGDT